MANVKTRIIQKHDSSANWAKATTFVPLKGEIIIYDDLGKIKIGDGATKVNDLPFANEGTITGIKMNGVSKGTSGVVDLGTVITSHQSLDGKQDKLTTAQLNAVNSGITSDKVKAYDGYSGTLTNMSTTINQQGNRLNTLEAKPGLDKVGTITSINNQTPDSQGNIALNIPSPVSEATVSGWGFTKNTGTYSKPSGGIPKTDLASAVQASLTNADNAVKKVKINGAEKTPTSGVVDLGTVITAHQSLDGKQDKITETNKLSYNLLTDTPDLSNAPDIPDLSEYIQLLNSDTLSDEAINYIKTFKKISGVKISYISGNRIQVYLPLMSTQTVLGEVVRYTFLGEPTNYSGQSYISMTLQLNTKKIT